MGRDGRVRRHGQHSRQRRGSRSQQLRRAELRGRAAVEHLDWLVVEVNCVVSEAERAPAALTTWPLRWWLRNLREAAREGEEVARSFRLRRSRRRQPATHCGSASGRRGWRCSETTAWAGWPARCGSWRGPPPARTGSSCSSAAAATTPVVWMAAPPSLRRGLGWFIL